ncbi:hypothetical protein D3X12_16305 [Pseudomonas protegens]|nr:hypothetical protein C1633_29825 [Pseudomonas protegens]QEZ52147.1 hypothetical protein D3X12_16305 [Pseudomonas protegens]QEZ55791.1 hypothetical protein D4N38_03170 [Pseudomonas protegens]QEZ63408.1 hypothetical protein D4N37_11625 [Pseudomonas protegens]
MRRSQLAGEGAQRSPSPASRLLRGMRALRVLCRSQLAGEEGPEIAFAGKPAPTGDACAVCPV